MRLIDLSLPLEHNAISEPKTFGDKFGSPAQITFFSHKEGAELYVNTFDCA